MKYKDKIGLTHFAKIAEKNINPSSGGILDVVYVFLGGGGDWTPNQPDYKFLV